MRFPCLIIGILAVLLILVLLWACRVAGPAFYNGNGVDEPLGNKVPVDFVTISKFGALPNPVIPSSTNQSVILAQERHPREGGGGNP